MIPLYQLLSCILKISILRSVFFFGLLGAVNEYN